MASRIYDNKVIKIVTGIVLVGGSVFLVQWLSGFVPEKLTGNREAYYLAVAVIQCVLSVWCYILLYRYFEKRPVTELSRATFPRYAASGFLAGILLQSLIVLILYLAGGYIILQVNPASFMIPAFTTALTAGFVVEIIIRGIVFRLVEEKLGTLITIGLMMLLFLIMHLGSQGSGILSDMAVTMQAGFLLSAAYVLTRNLWFPVFMHFAWDFAEPGIFGAFNPGNSIEKSLFTCQVSGPDILTGGSMGPVNSIQSLFLCTLTGLFFLWLAKKRKHWILRYRKKSVIFDRPSESAFTSHSD